MLALALIALSAAAGTTAQQLRALDGKYVCEQTAPGVVVFIGDSIKLGPCLDGLEVSQVSELRMTSLGGGAWATLQDMRRFEGRIDLLVIDQICASSCANYVIPTARRLRVLPDSLVLLHGSLSLRDLDLQESSTRAQIRAALKPVRKGKSDTEIEQEVSDAWKSFRQETSDHIPVQEDFALHTLNCGDWLEPKTHLASGPPEWMSWLLVTPEMARRCLKNTAVIDFSPPGLDADMAKELGFLRARY